MAALENGTTMRTPATTHPSDTRTTAVHAAELTMVHGSGAAQVHALDGVTVAFPAAELTAFADDPPARRHALSVCITSPPHARAAA